MIKSVTVVNQRDESVKMVLSRPQDSGFIVRKIDGLGPGKADINITEMANFDGGRFNSARLNGRNIVFDLGFFELPSVEENRQKTYKLFPMKSEVTLIFETDVRTTRIKGLVESNEPNIFSNSEATVISIICPIPYFVLDSELRSETYFGTIMSLFEFPWSNESLTENLLEFGSYVSAKEANIFYEGEIETGALFKAHFTGPAKGIKITNLQTGDYIQIDAGRFTKVVGTDGFIAGDDLYVNTVRGDKYAYLYREGSIYNLFPALSGGSSWPTLDRGDNVFAYAATSGVDYIQFSVEFDIFYWGV